MAIARPILGLVSLLLIAGGIVMTFFIVLSGAQVGGSSISQIYFLQADTGGVSNPNDNYRNPARWTYLAICGVQNGNNNDCTSTRAAQPFNPVGNFGTSSGLPDRFGSENHFYYLSRFAWVFYIIALFFAVVTFFLGMLALCTRLGSYLSGFTVLIACFFQALAAALMTAWTVQGRNAFRNNNQSASLGAYAYGFTWATLVCYFLASVFFCVGGRIGKNDSGSKPKRSLFSRKRSTRSRGSFVDSESQRRVKDEYD
ncbi:SUR7-domain-containing protein [Hortaea werneckii]|uniref:MARVEL domain-containing protein n=1 Tax=Hortaea werneckii TaxID=91943 RepID=A0A3M7I0V4_HORWE|nr:SUR7-domain-containing protein [Hortaea werneckii]KAI7003765.1 SUR7-domain-containing protein [Hortaea werneckii]KAI7386988.1 SUR7-domain-containing protein [Hortaea werneckii]KAI7414081.1 SUR7-domain-containing protein [Hortaea werneckii]KAI7414182.1 SUR7-domain-containing protein [Hortaea werneckii]